MRPDIDVCKAHSVVFVCVCASLMNELKLQENEEDDKRSGSMLPALDLNFVASVCVCFVFSQLFFWVYFVLLQMSLEPRLALGLMTGVDRRPKQNCRH